jgi:nucleoside-diphosphate-sugar epimerase
MVYGPSNLGNIVRLIVAIEKGLPLPLGAIRNQRSFLFIGNLVAAIEATLQDPQASRKVYAISDGEPISTPELVKMIGRYGNKDARVLSVPVWMLRILGKAGDVASVLLRRKLGFDTYAVDRLCESAILDDTAIRNELGFISPFSTEEGICHTMSQNPSAPMEYFRHLMNKSKVRA